MEEKIKVSLPKATLELLKKDCDDFKILKDNGAPNMNAFINTLIVNFHEEFSAGEEALHDEIKKALFSIPEYYKEDTFNALIKIFAKRNGSLSVKKESSTLSFKPTRVSSKTVLYIENVLLKNESLSSFYCRMFSSYAKKTKNEREKIICKENYEILQKSIKKGVQVCIILKSGSVMNNVSVFSVSSAKDELFNYVLAYGGKNNKTVRLASIDCVSLLTDKAEIPEKNRILFERQIVCGAQYPIYPSDNEDIKVQLTEKGKELFQKIYLYRPTPTKIEGDIYTFNCSANQVLYYFERFGESALILSPKRLGIYMRNYYYYALKKYRNLYGKDL